MASPILKIIEGALMGRIKVDELQRSLDARRSQQRYQSLREQLMLRELNEPPKLSEFERYQQDPEGYAAFKQAGQKPRELSAFEQFQDNPEAYANFKQAGQRPTEYDQFLRDREGYTEFKRAGQQPSDFELFQRNPDLFSNFKQAGQQPTDFEQFQGNPEAYTEFRRSGQRQNELGLFLDNPEQFRQYQGAKQRPETEKDRAMAEYYRRRTDTLGQTQDAKTPFQLYMDNPDAWRAYQEDRGKFDRGQDPSLAALRRLSIQRGQMRIQSDLVMNGAMALGNYTGGDEADMAPVEGVLAGIRAQAMEAGIDLNALWAQLESQSATDIVDPQSGEVMMQGVPLSERLGPDYTRLKMQFIGLPNVNVPGMPTTMPNISFNLPSPSTQGFTPAPGGKVSKPQPGNFELNMPGVGDMSEEDADLLLNAIFQ